MMLGKIRKRNTQGPKKLDASENSKTKLPTLQNDETNTNNVKFAPGQTKSSLYNQRVN